MAVLKRSESDERVAQRHKVFQPASMVTDAGDVRAHLLDISTNGARAHCQSPPAVGTAVVLQWTGARRTGRVAWSAGNRFGVEFTVPLTDDQIRALL